MNAVLHSEFSPSGSGRWLKCPGSIQAVRAMNLVHTPSTFAEEGTAAHNLAEMSLRKPDFNLKDMLGEVIYKGNQDWIVTEDMIEAVSVYQEHILSLVPDFDSLLIEQRVSLEHLHPNTFGTADAIIVNKSAGIIYVADYKHGKGIPVEAYENTQLMLYAVGVLIKLQEDGVKLAEFNSIQLHIIQPRCPHPEGPIRTYNITIGELQKFSKRARKAINNACSDDPYFEAGESQCRWCDFSPKCKTLAEYSLSLATVEFKDFSINEEELKKIPTLTDEEISHLIQKSPILVSWANSLKAYAQTELEKGREFPNFKLVRGRSNRIWMNEAEKTIIIMIKEGVIEGFESNDFYTTKFKTPSQTETLLGRKNKDLIKDLIIKPDGRITIAHISDRRPSVTPTADAENEFSVLLEKVDE